MLTTGRGLLVAAAFLTALPPTGSSYAGEGSEPMRVLVRGGSDSGFVAPGVSDSVADIKEKLNGKKVLRLTDDPEAADLVVEVMGRFKEYIGATHTTSTVNSYTGQAVSTTTNKKSAVVVANLVVGDYSLELVGDAGGFGKFGVGKWGGAAKSIAGQIEDFVKDNYEQLAARRNSASSTPTDLDETEEPAFPRFWASLQTGSRFIVRQDGEHIYVERVVPNNSAHFTAVLAPSDSGWAGLYGGWFVCDDEGNQCPREGTLMALTSVSEDRIEGWGQEVIGEEFDCKRCRWKEEPKESRSDFVWLPAGRP